MNDRLNDDWKNLFEQLPIDTSAREEHREDLRMEVFAAYESDPTPQHQRPKLKDKGRFLMKYKAPHWTVAAILIACAIWFVRYESPSAFAIEEVVDNVMKARSARFDMQVSITGQPAIKMKGFFLAPNHYRQELENGHITIYDWQALKMVSLDPKTKQATVFNMLNLTEEQKRSMQLNEFDMVRESLSKAISDPDSNIESLGKKKLDGRTVVGFRLKTKLQPMTVWADPRTKYPVRIEATMPGPTQTKVVMTNYEFNVKLDKSLFSIIIPQGYNVTKTDIDLSTGKVDLSPANELKKRPAEVKKVPEVKTVPPGATKVPGVKTAPGVKKVPDAKKITP